LTGVQLHGNESPAYCHLRQLLPNVEIVKAIRVRSSQVLAQTAIYTKFVDTLLLDAYPQQLGGTGKTLDWTSLRQFRPSCPWLLAGD
jgi:phosphoribosylanthranilate isomerase